MRLIKVFFLLISFYGFSQEKLSKNSNNIWRVNFLNPSVEYEFATGTNSAFSAGLGIGYSVSYPHTDVISGTGFIYAFNPFLDLQHKWFYNFNKRKAKKLNIEGNSGNFVSTRLLTRSSTLFGNSSGTDGFDFAIGPTWGIQRKYGKNFHFMFDMGPIYYFDLNGNGYYFPLMVQINLGFNL